MHFGICNYSEVGNLLQNLCTQNVGCQRKSNPMLSYSIVRGGKRSSGCADYDVCVYVKFVDLQSTMTQTSSDLYVPIVLCLLQ